MRDPQGRPPARARAARDKQDHKRRGSVRDTDPRLQGRGARQSGGNFEAERDLTDCRRGDGLASDGRRPGAKASKREPGNGRRSMGSVPLGASEAKIHESRSHGGRACDGDSAKGRAGSTWGGIRGEAQRTSDTAGADRGTADRRSVLQGRSRLGGADCAGGRWHEREGLDRKRPARGAFPGRQWQNDPGSNGCPRGTDRPGGTVDGSGRACELYRGKHQSSSRRHERTPGQGGSAMGRREERTRAYRECGESGNGRSGPHGTGLATRRRCADNDRRRRERGRGRTCE